jgi:HPt (histidine-containing phosphotransfer) domain-containing protein
VVAVTANALGGDEERFLELGFDDYLSKPFRQSQLLTMLNHQLPPSKAAQAKDAEPQALGAATLAPNATTLPPSASNFLDASALQRLRDLDPKGENHLMERVIKAFEASVERLLPQMREAQLGGNLAGVRHVAHTFKSSSASIGAIQLSQMCAELENLIRLERVDNLDERIKNVHQEIQVVLKALQDVLGPQR